MRDWFYRERGTPAVGPVALATLLERIGAGRVSPRAVVLHVTPGSSWRAIVDVPELAAIRSTVAAKESSR